MSEAFTELTFITQQATGQLRTINLVDLGQPLRPAEVSLELVTAINIDGNDSVTNPDHSNHIDLLDLEFEEGEDRVCDSIVLPKPKAIRLLKSFAALRRNHTTDCHDFVAAVENWGQNNEDGLNCRQDVLPSDDNVRSGTPYVVLSRIRKDEIESDEVRRTHSCLATDGGRLLSVMGKGSMLSLMEVDTTKSFYSGGGTGYLSQAISPEFAATYPNGIVPASAISR